MRPFAEEEISDVNKDGAAASGGEILDVEEDAVASSLSDGYVFDVDDDDDGSFDCRMANCGRALGIE
jgi:hypothetical protein